MSPTLRAFRLREPMPKLAAWSDALCRTKLPGLSFHLIPSMPKAAETARRRLRTRRLRSPRGLSVWPVDARAPSIGPISTLRWSGRNAERIRTNVHDRAPSSHRTNEPAWLGHWACRHDAIAPSTHAACAPRACEKRRLSPNLCSRLVFKCTQRNITFPGGGSHLLISIRD
jgi:hypothetical protein